VVSTALVSLPFPFLANAPRSALRTPPSTLARNDRKPRTLSVLAILAVYLAYMGLYGSESNDSVDNLRK
jgi:hypothetical protein